jgi:dienelactone hydrolase
VTRRSGRVVLVVVVVAATLGVQLVVAPVGGAIVQHDLTLVDASRPTPCTGAPDRTLQVSVFVPDGAGPFPVVLVAPGSGASQRAVARADAAAFASRGYVGVAIPFPCTNAPGQSTTDLVVALDVYRQPADVSFVLDQLLARNADPSDDLFGLLDPARIGFTGTSSGGVTGLLFFNTCCTDARIRAMVVSKAFALPTAPGLPVDGTYDWSRPVPLYLWAACDDVVTPFDLAYDAFLQASPPKFFFQDLTGAHDTPVVFPPGTHDAFVDRYVAGDPSPALLATLLGAATDPSYAFAVGDASRTTVPPCRPEPAPLTEPDVVEIVPALTG